MGIIELKNVSKFYYKKGMITSAFSRINLSFDMGEFVIITGESGSGKSTLLNVISGLDTYEEGEMYINGNETSHYTEKDLEDYRRTYIGNIFQNFNLVDSYTVYQNIELVLLLNGNKRKNIKKDVLNLIKKVGLYKYRNTKVSKLSGGQKQKVAIARALAKNTKILICDEPTGNIDSKSATEIIKLLHEVSKDKLVIIVTHNFEQFEKYATRVIKMHDGKVLEDKIITKVEEQEKFATNKYKDITFLNKLRLSIRNTFNIVPKFLLIFLVYLFVTLSITIEYSSMKFLEYEEKNSGYNYMFNDIYENRIVINKKDKTPISNNDIKALEQLENIDYVYKNDLFLDYSISLENNNFYIYGYVRNINSFNKTIDFGRTPSSDNEAIYMCEKNYCDMDNYLNKEFNVENTNIKIKIVGISYYTDITDYNDYIYLSDSLIEKIASIYSLYYTSAKVLFLDTTYDNLAISPNKNVPKGNVYINEYYSYSCPNNTCKNKDLTIETNNLYYNNKLTLKVDKIYNKKNFKTLLNLTNYDDEGYYIFINPEDYNTLYDTNTYQSSVFIKDTKNFTSTLENLNNLGYDTLSIKDTLINDGSYEIIKIVRLVVTVIMLVVMFFISYFVLKLILKSRNKYFTTLRLLGSNKKVLKKLLIMELVTVCNLVYFIFIILTIIYKNISLNISTLEIITYYLTLKDYIILYIILVLMSYLISSRYSRKIFKDSVITTLKEEVL